MTKAEYKVGAYKYWDTQDMNFYFNQQLNRLCLTSMAEDYINFGFDDSDVPEDDEEYIYELAVDYCNDRNIEVE